MNFNEFLYLAFTTFLNMAIISVRVSNDIPIQSEYLPLITLYFVLSLLFTFISFAWFVYLEYLKSQKYLPAFTINFFLSLKRKIQFINKIKDKQNKTKSTGKNEIEETLAVLNNLVFFIIFIVMFSSFLSIWLIISSP